MLLAGFNHADEFRYVLAYPLEQKVLAAVGGFYGQVERGWDALFSLADDLVLLFGLLLPWLGVIAVAGGVITGIVRLANRLRPSGADTLPRCRLNRHQPEGARARVVRGESDRQGVGRKLGGQIVQCPR